MFSICIMCGCGLSNQDKAHENTDNNKENIYNNNDKIVQEDNNYTYVTYGDSIKNNQIEIHYTGFSGIDTIYFLDVKEDCEITFNYNSTVDKGNFKSVLISPKNEVETILEGTKESSKTIKLTKGKY